MGVSDNTVLRVDTPTGDPLVLRLHTAPDLGARAVTSELVWLDSLGGVGDGVFPRPRRSLSGEGLVELGGPGRTPFASLLTWVPGDVIGGPLNVVQARQAGGLLAALHRHAEAFVPPEGFERPTYDLASFRRHWENMQTLLGPARVTDREAATIEASWPTFEALLEPLHNVPGGFGLIHGDAHPGNLLWDGKTLRIIDFGRLGWGAYLYDIAYAVLDFGPAERAALMEGYRSVRGLPGGVEPSIRALTDLSALDNLAFLARQPHEHEFVLKALPSVVEAIARLTAERPAT
nr:phosphotransferase [Deinococcus aestuarii]